MCENERNREQSAKVKLNNHEGAPSHIGDSQKRAASGWLTESNRNYKGSPLADNASLYPVTQNSADSIEENGERLSQITVEGFRNSLLKT